MYLQNLINNVHDTKIFLSDNIVPDGCVEISVKSKLPMVFVYDDFNLNLLTLVLLEGYKKFVQSFEKDNDFFEPSLIFKVNDNVVSIKSCYKKKENHED